MHHFGPGAPLWHMAVSLVHYGVFTLEILMHDGLLDLRWIHELKMDSWIPGFWIHNGLLDSRQIPGFTMDSWIHDGFLDSQCAH